MRKRTRIFVKRSAWRGGLWVALPLAGLLALRLAAGACVAHRLESAREATRAAGIPTSEAELPGAQTIPAGENAADLYLPALRAFRVAPADRVLRGWVAPLTVDADDAVKVRRVWAQNQAFLDTLEAVAVQPRMIWPRHQAGGSVDAPNPYLLRMAIVQAGEGHAADALRFVRLGFVEWRMSPSGTSAASAYYAVNDIYSVLEQLVPTLDFKAPTVAAETRRLLEEIVRQDSADGLNDAWASEVAYTYPSRSDDWVLGPLWDQGGARALEYCAIETPAAKASSYPEWRSLLVQPRPDTNDWFAQFDWRSAYNVISTLRNMAERNFYVLTTFRAAQLELAARLYAAENGRFPDSPAQLVPRWLARSPTDPFDPSGGPLHYRVDGDGPTIWSVGFKGTNQGAALMPALGYGRFRYSGNIVYGAAWRAFLKTRPPR